MLEFISGESPFGVASVIVSLSGIRAETLDDAAELATELDDRGVPLSLLVAPRLRGGYRLAEDAATLEWLHGRKGLGDAIVLHGYDQASVKRRRAEFATLPEHEAALRLTAADRVLEAVGLRSRLFAPPRWVASPGALAALPRIGFALCADLTAVRDLRTGAVLRSRVLGVGGGNKTEPWWCRAMVMGAGRIARRGGLVRVSLDAKHLSRSGPRQAVLDALDLALHHGAVPQRYQLAAVRRAA
ncbi:MAG: DUF2334 domain-containing protein [Mycobacteriaceae bacterium]